MLDFCEQHSLSEYIVQQSRDFRDKLWKVYLDLLEGIPTSFEGKTIVDFGCKYGHVLPLFLSLGAGRAVGIDVEPKYVEGGRAVLEKIYSDKVEIKLSDMGLIPLGPDTVDFVFVNEVISHINPMYLDIVYSEIARILKIGGVVFISDGNNRANPEVFQKLKTFWELYEFGPDGVKTDRDTVIKSYLTLRKEIIASHYPDLPPDKINFLALNTSGLFGDRLLKVIDDYVRTGELIRRPYRKGTCPTNPIASGVMIERSFHPLQVEMSLSEYGIESRQLFPNRKGLNWRGRLYFFFMDRLKNIFSRDWHYKEEGFQIIGVKKY